MFALRPPISASGGIGQRPDASGWLASGEAIGEASADFIRKLMTDRAHVGKWFAERGPLAGLVPR
jgi:hypothetical protein